MIGIVAEQFWKALFLQTTKFHVANGFATPAGHVLTATLKVLNWLCMGSFPYPSLRSKFTTTNITSQLEDSTTIQPKPENFRTKFLIQVK